jgi:mono/diheme cytochrome c family protein
MLDLDGFTDFVDIYFAVSLPTMGSNIFVLRPDISLQPLSTGLVPWKKGVTGPINETLIENLPLSDVAPGNYTFYLLAAPANTLSNFYLWKTELKVGATDGPTLYAQSCASCHGSLASSSKIGATATRIQDAVNANAGGMGGLSNLSAAQVQAIANALATQTPPPPPTAADGPTLYAQSCASCHGSLARSEVRGASVSEIQSAISRNKGGMGVLAYLSPAHIQSIATALSGTSAAVLRQYDQVIGQGSARTSRLYSWSVQRVWPLTFSPRA